LFSAAAYRSLPDPLDRLLAYVDFRKAILKGEQPQFTCLLGTMVQEAAEAMRQYGVVSDWSARSLALYTQAVIQGAFILAKAQHGPQVAADCLDHLRRYLELLFAKQVKSPFCEDRV
jgi:TetR/AcrR family transcriptional repressor of nem operon